ncbi:tRNA-dihydrouridine(20a/20b) synthase [NAD(P)+]-like [Daldinia childiae]|uniref:tRNA-dihydrouridine(20a/20b) synthase [NAD(P)+]-like n=1 Tax=Daldinia childiae TaxID=326645 RepID=UPI0014459F18|nr:tRNA-dihydrouridine(20a/20b) synthase [NAD(P)+]-like [Daldinia childiae]KAF3061894.1 tRNA-dihydrouridine(20a/20b) synthase [NAD(P)+]-like [Daldinia childiae]
MDLQENGGQLLQPKIHPLKLFDAARSQKRLLYACAPMVRYSKLAFRQTVHHFGTDLCWTPMILAKEFNRSSVARDSDLTVSSTGAEVPTIAQFGANDPVELSRAASLAAPFVNGVDLNCGCPQSWACAETLGAALMGRRELVRDMVVATRERLARDGWDVDSFAGADSDVDGRVGRSVSVKIRVHKDLRQTVDFITTVLGDEHHRNIDWLTIHPRTRNTPSSIPINVEALEMLTSMFGTKLPILVSGDVFTLSTLPYTSHLLDPQPTFTTSSDSSLDTTGNNSSKPKLHLPNLSGLMSARALLANPALFAGYNACPWEAVDVFMNNVARAPLPLKLAIHHLNEMCGPGFGPDRNAALLSKKERIRLNEISNWIDVIDYMDEIKSQRGGKGGVVRFT